MSIWNRIIEALDEVRYPYNPGSYEIVDTTTGTVVKTAGSRMDASDECAFLNRQARSPGERIYVFRRKEKLGEAGYNPGWRRNSIWDRADDATRTAPAKEPPAPKGPKPPAEGPIVWHGRSMRDNDLFQTKNDKKTGRSVEAGLIPALKAAGGTITRAPDGSGIAVCPSGYRIDHTVWKEWGPTRAKAEMDAVSGGNPEKRNAYDLKTGAAGQRNRLPTDLSKKPGGTTVYDVLVQGRVQNNQGVLVTKVVWAPVDQNSIDASAPEARQAKLDLLMDTDDPSELAQMFPSSEPKQNTLGKPPKPVDMGQNPLAAPTKVQWTKGNAPEPAARPSSWDDIDLNRMPKKKV